MSHEGPRRHAPGSLVTQLGERLRGLVRELLVRMARQLLQGLQRVVGTSDRRVPDQELALATDLLADEDLGVRREAAQAFAAHPEEIAPSLVALREAAAAETAPELARVLQDLLRGR